MKNITKNSVQKAEKSGKELRILASNYIINLKIKFKYNMCCWKMAIISLLFATKKIVIEKVKRYCGELAPLEVANKWK